MKIRWTFRCYPTPEQTEHLGRTFGCVRYVWNWALRMRSDAYRAGERVGYAETDRRLTALKAQPDTAWLNEVSSVCLQQALRDQQQAFAHFFDKRAAYPAFKRKAARQGAHYTSQGFTFDAATRTLKIAKIGAIKVRWSRQVIPHPSSVRLIRTASGRYFVSLVVDVAPVEHPATGAMVGVDFGVARLATLSNGERIANPKHGDRHRRALVRYQRRMARQVKDSRRRERTRRQIARIHERIADSRTDTLHKFSTDLVRRFDVICLEDLNVRGMVKNHNLARALHDAAIGQAGRMIEEKAARAGKIVVRIDRFYPSRKTCSACGHILSALPLSVRDWTCPECGARHDRDENAARTILAVGQTVTAHGDGVRAKRATARRAGGQRSANQRGAA